MKRITTFFAIVIAFVSMTAMVETSNNVAEFKFDVETHDFGTIPQGKPVTHEFSFTNVGTEPIIISEVKTSCGCSVAEYTKTPVKAGEKGIIKVTFNAAAKGPFTKNLTVRSNTKTPVKILYINGEVKS